jgi:sugar lactone lactonase YvrE
MTIIRTRGFSAAVVLSLAAAPLQASSPKYFQAASQGDFLKGDLENLAIDAAGRLMLGPSTTLVYETPAPFLWSMVAQPDGTLFVGTGNEGKVYRINPSGAGSVFFDSGELEVHALAAAPNGGLYVATSPDGRIYKVDRNGAATTFFDPDDKYIWSLAVDARGNVYAGTGNNGVIYKIGPDGTGAVFYKASATHVTALAVDRAGTLFAGTGSPGRVLRIDASGKPFVVLDSPFQEIHTLRFDAKGLLYAAALGAQSTGAGAAPSGGEVADTPAPPPSPAPVATVTAEVTSITVVDAGSGSGGSSTASRPGPGSLKGAVYRITPDGVWDSLWESRDDSPYDLAFDRSGAVLVGTGGKGKIYRLEGDPRRPTLLARAAAQQVTAFYQDARGQLYYATANPGKVFRLGVDRASRGTYESEPRDARMIATWGALSWHGTAGDGSRIELYTRSGNTDTPDDTWSPWSAAYANADGSPMTSPKARYLQWRAVLTGRGEGPVLTSIRAAYLQRNLRPQVRSVTVHPPGIVFQKPYSAGEPELAGFDDQSSPERKLAVAAAQPSGGSGQSLGRRAYQKGLQTFVWRADDDNDDDLVYDVLYRREGETSWKTLRRGMSESILVWDTTTVPNGTYFVKVVASDSPSNPADAALTGELESVAFEIDNTPPALTVTAVRVERGATIVSVDAVDDHSPIKVLEYSQDGQQWRGAFPTDGIADSRSEHYELTIAGELSDRGLSIRATDAMNNVGSIHVDRPAR